MAAVILFWSFAALAGFAVFSPIAAEDSPWMLIGEKPISPKIGWEKYLEGETAEWHDVPLEWQQNTTVPDWVQGERREGGRRREGERERG